MANEAGSPPSSLVDSILFGVPETTAHLLCNVGCELAECSVYDDRTNEILWTDILGKKFFKLSLESGQLKSYELPKMLCAFALLESPTTKGYYLCAWEDGFEIYDIENSRRMPSLSIVGEPVNPAGLPTRLNDGRCDREGKFFICGGYFGGIEDMHMKVYRCSYDSKTDTLTHEPIIDKIQVTNSLCFSLDGSTMYLADSATKTIWNYDYKDGEISEKRTLMKRSTGNPDGSCIDSEGYLWSAVWRGGEGPSFVVRVDPVSGKEVYRIKMPDNTSQVSCCCFGGTDLDVLFITTAAESRRDSEMNAGGIYAVKLPFKGLPENRFKYM